MFINMVNFYVQLFRYRPGRFVTATRRLKIMSACHSQC